MSDPGRAADVKVGLFVVAALAILVIGSLWIAGSTLFGSPRVTYRVVLRDSAGLQAGDRVRIAGVSVGRIRQVDLDSGTQRPVTLYVAVRREVAVHLDARARIATAGLLGTPYLQILPGSPTEPRLAPNGEIPGEAAAGLEAAMARMDDLAGRAVDVLDRAARLIDQVSGELDPILAGLQAVLSEDNVSDVRGIVTTLRRTLEESGPRLDAMLASLERTTASLDATLDGMPELRDQLASVLLDVDAALGVDGERVAGVLDSARTALDSADSALSTMNAQRGELEATIRDLRDTVANLKEFSRNVKERPYSLVRIRHESDRRPGDVKP